MLGDTLNGASPLNPFQSRNITVYLDVPVGTAIGQVLTSASWVSSPSSEITLTNNTFDLEQTVTASFDPNDKRVRTSTGWSDTQYFHRLRWLVGLHRPIPEHGTDTAFTVVITDSLDIDLDQATYEQGQASHPFDVEFLPGRVVQWTFPNILLPDSGTNEPASHGLVQFRIRPMQPEHRRYGDRQRGGHLLRLQPPVRTNDVVVVFETNTRGGWPHHVAWPRTQSGIRPGDPVCRGPAPWNTEILDMSGRCVRSMRTARPGPSRSR